MTPQNDFLDNLANDQHQKMLREIANDNITPKKRDTLVQNDVYERKNDDFEDDGLDYEVDAMTLTEF
jgi:phosphopantothenoylcysteine synthetase/decarboxylase